MRILAFILIILSLINFMGCKNIGKEFNEIGDLTFVQVIGVDKEPHNGNIKVTVVSKTSKIMAGAQEENSIEYSGEGSTIFEALRSLSKYADKNPFWGHVEYIIIGEAAAEDNIIKYLDFFLREHQLRIKSKIFIVKESTAQKVMDTTNTKDMSISDRLNTLLRSAGDISESGEMTLGDLTIMLDESYSSSYAPSIHLEKLLNKMAEDENKNDIVLDGYSVFKESKMIGFIKGSTSKGLNLMVNKFDSSIVVGEDSAGEGVSLEIIKANTKIKPEFDSNGDLTIEANIEIISNIGEYQGKEDIFEAESIKNLEKQQEKIIKSYVESSITFAKENKVDIFGIGNKVWIKYPHKWQFLKDDWEYTFSNTPIKVIVESKINKTYDINKPTGEKGGK